MIIKYSFKIALLFLVCSAAMLAVAQETDPKPEDGPTEEDVAAAKAALEERRREAEERERLRPVLEAIAETNPTSPFELIGAIESLINLEQPEEAKKYIRKLLSLKLGDEAMFVLQRKVGSGVFVKLAADKRYHPEGEALATAVLTAADKQSRTPERIEQLVRELNDPSPSIRALAVSDLKDAGYDGVLAMIAALADKARAAEHPRIRVALYQMGEAALDPLIGVLGSDDADLKVQAVEILGWMESSRATPYLIHPLRSERSTEDLQLAAARALERIIRVVPTERDAQIYLAQRVKELIAGDLPKQATADGTITLWLWDPAKKLPAPVTHEADDAALVVAAQLSADLYELWPDNAEYRRDYLMAMLESTKLLAGLDRSLPSGPGSARELAAATGVAAVEDVLVTGMEQDRTAAAIAAAEVLGDIGDDRLLISDDGRPRALVDALVHGNRRLRFAAAEAIMKIDPHHDYPGASYLPETLGYLATSAGRRRILIGHPRSNAAQSMVGMLTAMGFETVVAGTGRNLFRTAAGSPDFELLFLSDAINDPPLHDALQLLRRDRRTARLPIAVMARGEKLRQLQSRTEDDPLTATFPRPHDAEAMQFQVRRLIEMAGRSGITDEERRRHASAAMAWLSVLAESPEHYGFYDLLRIEPQVVAALFSGPAPTRAAEFLGLIGSPRAQRALTNFASENGRDLSDRQAAAEAFSVAVRKRGLLLLDNEIDRQYQRYNQSELLDAGTQAVLGQILDTIERQLILQKTGKTLEELAKQPSTESE